MPAKIKFLGGVRTVTGSSHLVTTGNSEVLLDAGLFHGHRDQFYAVNTIFHFNPYKLNALLLSHAHIDHCGNLPSLVKKGIRCKIYATAATRDLCKLMLEDSGKIQEEDTRYLNKVNRRLGLPLRKPLYTKKEALRAAQKIRRLSYNQRLAVARDIFATFYDAGHILGSATIVLEIKEDNRTIRLGYAVDLGRKGLPMLNDPEQIRNLDYLILESTYGGRLHAPIQEAKTKLKDAIVRTVQRKGKIIIPAFTLERAQEVIYYLNELLEEKSIPQIPVYVDSPLATDITDVFSYHADFMDSQTRQAIDAGNTPFEFVNLRYIRQQQESKTLNMDKRPMIILAGSGMCESGRILHHLKNNIEDSRNTVLVVGYMAQDTLGRRIVERQKIVRIFGLEHELNAEVVVINAFSGHADQKELLDFALAASVLKRVFLVHGDMDQTRALEEALREKGIPVCIPSRDEEILLD